jgi:asparagine synthase (glutamine-hydrolysing)
LRFERPWLGQHKVFHFRVWYRDFLASYVKEMLLDPKSLSRDFVDRRGVELLVQAHLSGTGNYTNQIHKLLTLEIFYRTFLDNSTYVPATKTLSDHWATA